MVSGSLLSGEHHFALCYVTLRSLFPACSARKELGGGRWQLSRPKSPDDLPPRALPAFLSAASVQQQLGRQEIMGEGSVKTPFFVGLSAWPAPPKGSNSQDPQCQPVHKVLLEECPRAVLGKVGNPIDPLCSLGGEMAPWSQLSLHTAASLAERGQRHAVRAARYESGNCCDLGLLSTNLLLSFSNVPSSPQTSTDVTEVSGKTALQMLPLSFFSTFCHWIYHFLSIAGLPSSGWSVFYTLYYKETHTWGKQERSKWKTNHRPSHESFWGKHGLGCIL